MTHSSASSLNLYRSIKLCFLQGKHRHCISICTQALDSDDQEGFPLRTTFLYFYAALSYEALAQGMYIHSPTLESTFDEAEYCFLAADGSLPPFRSAFPFSDSDDVFDDCVSALSKRSLGRRSIASFGSTLSYSTELSSVSSVTSLETYDGQNKGDGAHNKQFFELDVGPEQAFDEGLEIFHQMLENHIKMLRSLRESKIYKCDKGLGPSTDCSLYTQSGPGTCSKIPDWQKTRTVNPEQLERIRRGRARGWKKERFNAEKYQRLCNAALLELYSASTS